MHDAYYTNDEFLHKGYVSCFVAANYLQLIEVTLRCCNIAITYWNIYTHKSQVILIYSNKTVSSPVKFQA